MEPTFPEGTIEKHVTLSTGIKLRYFERGSGDVILFLHGFPELALSFREQFALSDAGFRCVAPDMRGYGGSDAPTRTGDYGVPTLVADVVALIDSLGARSVHLVGHDWGGAIAWEVARAHPNRIKTLSVLNCPPGDVFLRELKRRPKQLRMSWYMLFFQLPWLPEWMILRDPLSALLGSFRGNAARGTRHVFTPQTVAPYVASAKQTRLAGLNYYRAVVRGPKVSVAQTPIAAPVQLIWGVHDKALGPWFTDPQLYARVATHFRVVRVGTAGHWVQQEAPSEVNAALLEHVRAPQPA